VEKGARLALSWLGTDAAEAFQNKRSIPRMGVTTITVDDTESQSFVFKSGSKSATCTVTLLVLDVEVDQKSLVSERSTPTLTGNATGIKTLSLEIWDAQDTKKIYTRNSISVKKDDWKAKISKKLSDGAYTVHILTAGKDRQLLKTETLIIGDVPVSRTQLIAEPVSLLTGGLLKAKSSVPVSYLHVVNTGKDVAHITGFTLTQHGNASTDVITGLTVHDRGAIAGSSFPQRALFNREKEASVDTNIAIAPGESRVFTIKAQTAADMRPFLGTELKLDVTALETDASLKTQFPIRGTTWIPSL